MAVDPKVLALIVAKARQYGVDPEVALRVATGEGGIHFGAVGDHGTSFGPYQLHIGGASPYSDPSQASAFANSPAGIDYAVRHIAQFAKGKGVQAGVAAAVRGFERPAAPNPEIARDLSVSVPAAGSSNGRTAGSGPASVGSTPTPAASLTDPMRQLLASYLLQQSAASAHGNTAPDFGGLLGLALTRSQATAAQNTFGPKTRSSDLPVAKGTTGGSKGVQVLGTTGHEDPTFMQKLIAATSAVGGTAVRINSGERSPQHNAAVGGVAQSNHLPDANGNAHAVDGDVYIPGHGWVPLGEALLPVAGKFGLRSGDVPGFFNGGTDPVHVDDGFNMRG